VTTLSTIHVGGDKAASTAVGLTRLQTRRGLWALLTGALRAVLWGLLALTRVRDLTGGLPAWFLVVLGLARGVVAAADQRRRQAIDQRPADLGQPASQRLAIFWLVLLVDFWRR